MEVPAPRPAAAASPPCAGGEAGTAASRIAASAGPSHGSLGRAAAERAAEGEPMSPRSWFGVFVRIC